MTSRSRSIFRSQHFTSLRILLISVLLISPGLTGCNEPNMIRHHWSDDELALLQSMHISRAQLVANGHEGFSDIEAAIQLGQALFFDQTLSKDKKTSCASCHDPKRYFTSENKTDGSRNTPTVVGSATSTWQFWDGRSDSLWSQALIPFEAQAEHGLTRLEVVRSVLLNHTEQFFQSIRPSELSSPSEQELGTNVHRLAIWFLENQSSLPKRASPSLTTDLDANRLWNTLSFEQQTRVNQLFATIGKAIAAYQSQLMPAPSRFDDYVQALSDDDLTLASQILTNTEEQGLKLFLSEKSQCIRCHNGPMFTNHHFSVTAAPSSQTDVGRLKGIEEVLKSPFNCLGKFNTKMERDCNELIYMKREGDGLMHAFKVPSLRNVTLTAPYMHNGAFPSLDEVIDYYNRAPTNQLAHTELEPLFLLPYQRKQLVAFLKTLESGVQTRHNSLGKNGSLHPPSKLENTP